MPHHLPHLTICQTPTFQTSHRPSDPYQLPNPTANPCFLRTYLAEPTSCRSDHRIRVCGASSHSLACFANSMGEGASCVGSQLGKTNQICLGRRSESGLMMIFTTSDDRILAWTVEGRILYEREHRIRDWGCFQASVLRALGTIIHERT